MENDTQEYIVIYGATGLVGQELVAFLIKQGCKVVVLARNKNKAKELFANSVIVLSVNETKQNIFNDREFACLAVINLAGANVGAKAWTKKYKSEILESRLQSVDTLKQCVDQMHTKPKVWIQASAVGFYGANVTDETNEAGIKGDGFLADVVSKWEEALETYPVPQMRKVFLRIGIVMTTKGGFLQQMLKVANFGLVALPSKEKQVLAWIHLKDLVNIIAKSIDDANYIGKINAVSAKPAPIEKVKDLLLKNSKALFKIKAPKFLFKLVFGSQKTDEMLLANQNVISKKLVELNYNYQVNTLDDAF